MNIEVDMCSEAVLVAIEKENTEFLNEEFRKMSNNKILVLNRLYESKTTLLHFAIAHSSTRMVKYFLDKGLSPDSTTSTGQTALHIAVIYCKHRVVKLLLRRGCSVDRRDPTTRTALHYAMEIGTIPTHMTIRSRAHTRYMETRKKRQFASRANRLTICQLLRYGADVNASTKDGDTPLFQAIRHGDKILIRLFLGHGADVNHCKGPNENNALHYAVQKSSRDIVEILLDAGVDVNSGTRAGRTALHLAVVGAFCEETVNLLIERGASVNAEDKEGRTPIFIPVTNDEECNEEHVNYAEEQLVEITLRYFRILCNLLNAGADVNHVSSVTGESAFHRAVRSDIPAIVDLFLSRGADIHAKNRVGLSSLHIAVEYASEELMLQMLIDRGANIDDTSLMGATPLHLAVQFHKEEYIQLLLHRGADVNIFDVSGYTPLHYAARLVHLDEPTVERIVDVLLAHGADLFVKSVDDKNSLVYALEQSNPVMVKLLLHHLVDLKAAGDVKATKTALRAIENDEKWMQVYENRQNEIAHTQEENKRTLSHFRVNFWYDYFAKRDQGA